MLTQVLAKLVSKIFSGHYYWGGPSGGKPRGLSLARLLLQPQWDARQGPWGGGVGGEARELHATLWFGNYGTPMTYTVNAPC